VAALDPQDLLKPVVLAVITLCALLPGARTATAQEGSAVAMCDRACLEGYLNRYLDALVKHDPASAPMARNARFTENTVSIPVGEGLWIGANEAPTTFKIVAADPVAGQVAMLGSMQAWGNPALVSIRLKLDAGVIAEVEHLVTRQLRPDSLPNLQSPRAGLVEDVPPGERGKRDDLVRIANLYFDAIEQDKGSLAPFANECARRENGIQTTTNPPPAATAPPPSGPVADAIQKVGQLGCAANIDSQILSYITRIQSRRPLVVDEERGLVFSFPMFVTKGDVSFIDIQGVPGVRRIPIAFGAGNRAATEVFKIRGGRIYEIEAMGVPLPYLSHSGWDD
jgi:hypothetical protein